MSGRTSLQKKRDPAKRPSHLPTHPYPLFLPFPNQKMSKLFESYEKEYCDLSGAITCAFNELQTAPASGGGLSDSARAVRLREIDERFARLNEALRNMELELSGLPGPARVKLSPRMTNFQRDMTNLKKEYEKAKAAPGAVGRVDRCTRGARPRVRCRTGQIFTVVKKRGNV